MKKNIHLGSLVLLFYCFLTSCKEKVVYRMLPAINSNLTLNLDSSTFEIKIDSNRNYFYKVYSMGQDGIYCGFNEKLKSLDFFDFNKKMALNQTRLQTDGPNKIIGISACFYNSADSIFLLTNNNIYLVDSTGKIKSNIKINDKSEESFFKRNYLIEYDSSYNLFYDKKKSKLYSTSVSLKGMSSFSDFYSYPAAEIGLSGNKEIKNLLVPWSDLYKIKYYGYMNTPYFSINDKNVVFSFPVEPNIYVYNRENNSITVFGGQPDIKDYDSKLFISKNLSHDEKGDNDKKMLNFVRNVINGKIIPSADNKLYFRSTYLALEAHDKNDNNLKKQYLTVFDANFKRVKTLYLNDRHYVMGSMFSTKLGLFLPAPAGEHSLRFKVFNFKS